MSGNALMAHYLVHTVCLTRLCHFNSIERIYIYLLSLFFNSYTYKGRALEKNRIVCIESNLSVIAVHTKATHPFTNKE